MTQPKVKLTTLDKIDLSEAEGNIIFANVTQLERLKNKLQEVTKPANNITPVQLKQVFDDTVETLKQIGIILPENMGLNLVTESDVHRLTELTDSQNNYIFWASIFAGGAAGVIVNVITGYDDGTGTGFWDSVSSLSWMTFVFCGLVFIIFYSMFKNSRKKSQEIINRIGKKTTTQ